MTTSGNILATVPLQKIRRPAKVDRIEISEEGIRELAENIREQGLLQSPLLRKVGEEYEIIAGDRRILAITRLGWTEVLCVVAQMTDKQTAEARASENLAREDLTVIEEARIYENLHKVHGMTIEQIAQKMGKSAGTIKRRVDLLKMPQCLQTAMHKKQISYGVAEALWPITDPAALDYYMSFACDHGVTVTVARQWANDWKASQRRIETGDDPVEKLQTAAGIRPTYIACDLCEQPELIQDMKLIRLCKACARRIERAQMEREE
jgi:ParB/RepB/Spo0J family partition protein